MPGGETLVSLMQSAEAASRAGEWHEALAMYEAALKRVAAEGDAGDAATILRRIGSLHSERGDADAARDLYEASLYIAEQSELEQHIASALMCLAIHEQLTGQMQAAEALYQRALSIAEGMGDDRLSAKIEHNLGTLANIRGDLDLALQQYGAVLERHTRVGDDHSAAGILTNIGMARLDLGHWGKAEAAFAEALALAERLRDASLMGHVQLNRAELSLRQGRYELARECGDQALEIFGRLGSDAGRAEVFKLFGMLCQETSKSYQAATHFDTAVRLATQCQFPLLQAEVLSEWALVHLAEGRNPDALKCLNDAHRLFKDLSARRELLDLDSRLDGLEANYLKVVRAWGESIEAKDRYTAGHCERVANYACLLAQEVGISGRDLTWLRMGGYLHDVGKIAVPEELLNKAGKLTKEEFQLIQDHAEHGDAIVSELNFPWDIRPVVRWHHERWDGSGYPDGLKGEEIPIEARILCVADVYDALTTTRSYRPAMSSKEALGIMERDVGTFFDPALFPLFKHLISTASSQADQRFPEFGRTAVAAA